MYNIGMYVHVWGKGVEECWTYGCRDLISCPNESDTDNLFWIETSYAFPLFSSSMHMHRVVPWPCLALFAKWAMGRINKLMFKLHLIYSLYPKHSAILRLTKSIFSGLTKFI